jgi:hypothetical protein
MAKITRVTQAIFAAGAANNGIFGSAQANAGPGTIAANITAVQSLAAFAQGWLSATIGANKFPPLEEFQALEWMNTTQLAYLFQEGVPEYDAGTTYYHYSICKDPTSFKLYGSIVDANVGNALTNAAAWVLLINLATPGLSAASTSDTQTGTSTTEAVTPAGLAGTMIGGVGQTWQDVTGSRIAATNYTNSTGRPILVSVYCIGGTGASGALTVSGIVVNQFYFNSVSGAPQGMVEAIVPSGAVYSLSGGGSAKWCELR